MDGAPRTRQITRDTPLASPMTEYVLAATDAIVLTDRTGLILDTNAAFLEMIQVATEHQVRGVSLGRWLGRTSVDLGVLITNLRQRGSLKLFATHLRAEFGTLSDVEISAASIGSGAAVCLGFTIRDVGRRLPATGKRTDIAKSVDQMTELVGRVPMKDIVGNTAGLIEQMCIKAALELTRDNRAAAADLLGISRQSLYVKLRLYDLLGADDEA
jgi:transcriptional regulator PpsR